MVLGFNTGINTGANALNSTGISNKTYRVNVNTYNPRYPGFDEEDYKKLERLASSKGVTGSAKTNLMDELYQYYYPQVSNSHKLDERQVELNQAAYQNDGKEPGNTNIKLTSISQQAKQKYGISATVPDDQLLDSIVKGTPNGQKLLEDYINNGNPEFLYVAGIQDRPQEKKLEETGWQKAGDFAVGVAQSPGKWGYNIIGQWMDRLGKWGAEQLQGSDLQKWVQDKAVEMFGEDEVKIYQEEKAKQLEEGTAFKGRTQTDITKPILGEERANSGWTKGGEIVGDIASGIALTAPIAAATAPLYATSSLGNAALIGGLEGVVDTALTKYGSTGEGATAGELAVGGILGVGGGMLSRYLQNLPKNEADNIRKEATGYIEKSIKPTVKGKMNQADYNKFVDDTLDVVNYMDKNRGILQYTDDAGEKVVGKLPTNLRETTEALGNMKKTLYDQYNNIAKMAGDKGARVNMNQAFDKLDDLSRDVSQNIANPQTKQIVENFKNQLLEYTDDAGTIAIEDAQKLTQDFNQQLTAFFRNPNMNDVSKNSIISQLNKWTKDAINESIDDVLDQGIKKGGTASQEYQALKGMYGKIKTIEDEVAKRALVEARKNVKGLSPTILDAFAGGEATEALLTMNPGKLGKAAVMKFIGKYYKYLNDPNTQINNLFQLVQKTNNPNTSMVQEGLNIIKDVGKSTLQNTVKPNTMATTAEVLSND